MLSMLIAYDVDGNVVGTIDYMVANNENGDAVGLIDFEAHEKSGGSMTDIWQVGNAVGSGTWPEWVGGRAHDFKVERQGKKIMALVHKQSGHKRERVVVESAIQDRIKRAKGEPADIRDLVGGPDKPLILEADGRTRGRSPESAVGTPGHLPFIQRKILEDK